MQTEIEAKFLDINKDAFRLKLKNLGAKLVNPERTMIRSNYDYDDERLDKKSGWIRVRDEGGKVTLAYKQVNDRSLEGTKEVSVTVSSFKDTCNFLDSIGMKLSSSQETKRESWILDDAEIEIDTWPWIPSFVEIEAKDEVHIKSVAKKLGLDWSKALHGSVEIAYQAYYDVTEDDITKCPKIVFSDVPEWLEAKRIK